jgi:hypothetical protein
VNSGRRFASSSIKNDAVLAAAFQVEGISRENDLRGRFAGRDLGNKKK